MLPPPRKSAVAQLDHSLRQRNHRRPVGDQHRRPVGQQPPRCRQHRRLRAGNPAGPSARRAAPTPPTCEPTPAPAPPAAAARPTGPRPARPPKSRTRQATPPPPSPAPPPGPRRNAAEAAPSAMFDPSDPRNSVGRCGTQATSASHRRGESERRSTPSTRTRPEVGVTNPSSTASNVLFPDPLGPTKATREPAGTVKIHIGQRRNAVVGNRNPLEHHRRRTPTSATRPGTRSNHRHGKRLPQRRQPLRRRVELRARRPQRQVRLRRQDQDQQRRPRVKITGQQPEPDRHRHQSHRQRRHQFQHQRRQKSHPQRLHGRVGVGGQPSHAPSKPAPPPGRTPSASEPAHDVEEVPAQAS